MEISYLECQLVNAGRKEFSQWVANSLGSRSWGREGERSNIRIRIILIDPSSLLAQGMCIYTLLFYPFPFSVWSLWLFCKIPGQWRTAKTPRGNSSSTKWPRQQHMTSLLNPLHPFSEYKPELRLWNDSCVQVSVCVWVFGREFRHTVLYSWSCSQCLHSLVTIRVCCKSWHLLRLLGNCWSGYVDFAVNCDE